MQDTMMQRLSQAQLGKADLITGIENRYPDSNALSDMAGRYGQASGSGGDNRGPSLWSQNNLAADSGESNRNKTAAASSFGAGKYRPGYNSKGKFSPELLKMQTEAGMTGTVATPGGSNINAAATAQMSTPGGDRAIAYNARMQPGAPPTGSTNKSAPRYGLTAPTSTASKLQSATSPKINYSTPYKDTRRSALKGGAMFR